MLSYDFAASFVYLSSAPHFGQNFEGENGFWLWTVLPQASQNFIDRKFRKQIKRVFPASVRDRLA